VPDATTLLKFRHWLERHELTRVRFEEVGTVLEERGLLMRQGTTPPSCFVPEGWQERVGVSSGITWLERRRCW
jgi:IS5 family transposase